MNQIKCPICGYDEFVPFDEPIHDQYARLSGKAYICPNCGHVLWMSEAFPKFYEERMKEILLIDTEIMENELLINQLKSKTKDVSSNVKRLAELKKQLKQRLEWGDSGKVIRSLEEQIQEHESIIASGKNPNVQHDIDMVNNIIRELQSKKEELLRPVTARKLYN